MKFQRLIGVAFAATAALMSTQAVLAQAGDASDSYPDRPISMIVPYSVGGSTDIVSRLVAKYLGEGLGETVVVENKTGGGGIVGWSAVERSKPDGYTLLTTEMSFAIAAGLVPNLPFDPKKDFTQVVTLVDVPHVLVVNPSVPAQTVQELVALLKENPGKYFFGSGGVGTNTHLGSELFNSQAGVEMVHVPFRGASAAMKDVLGGEVQIMITSIPTALEQIRSGKLRALMVTSDERSEVLPDVPSAKEAGLPGMDMKFWVGFSVPAGTPAPIVEKLNKAFVKTLSIPEMRARLSELGLSPVGNTQAEATELVNKEIARWTEVIKNAGIKPE